MFTDFLNVRFYRYELSPVCCQTTTINTNNFEAKPIFVFLPSWYDMSRAKVHDDGNVITQQPSANPGPNENASVFPKTTELGTELEAIEELEKIVLSQVISACDRRFQFCSLDSMYQQCVNFLYK